MLSFDFRHFCPFIIEFVNPSFAWQTVPSSEGQVASSSFSSIVSLITWFFMSSFFGIQEWDLRDTFNKESELILGIVAWLLSLVLETTLSFLANTGYLAALNTLST